MSSWSNLVWKWIGWSCLSALTWAVVPWNARGWPSLISPARPAISSRRQPPSWKPWLCYLQNFLRFLIKILCVHSVEYKAHMKTQEWAWIGLGNSWNRLDFKNWACVNTMATCTLKRLMAYFDDLKIMKLIPGKKSIYDHFTHRYAPYRSK